MYKLFTDKNKTFSCDIEVEGANINESIARIIIESDNNVNLLYKGKILQNGKCEVIIDKMNILPEEMKGKIKLEVIAEGTLFTPWESTFVVETNKKVKVNEVYDPDSKTDKSKKVTVIVEDEKEDKKEKKVINEDFSSLDKHVTVLNDLIKQQKIKSDKIDVLFEKFEGLLATKKIHLNEKEINYIKNKIII